MEPNISKQYGSIYLTKVKTHFTTKRIYLPSEIVYNNNNNNNKITTNDIRTMRNLQLLMTMSYPQILVNILFLLQSKEHYLLYELILYLIEGN